MVWLSGYEYRKKGAVNATVAGPQADCQCELIVGESSGATGEDVHCGAKCQDFPNDIRFTKEDGATKHDYWIDTSSLEGTTPNRGVRVVIEVASIPASGSVDFYMYYGKSNDSGESNGANTFLNFDEFKRADTSGEYFEDFLDDYNEESHSNLLYSVHKPVKYSGNPVFSGGTWDTDKNYNDVHYIDGKFKMWYHGRPGTPPWDNRICYAESGEGLTWTRPNLGIVEYDGNSNNNIIVDKNHWGASVYYDEGASDPDKKYILLTPLESGVPCGSDQGIYFSQDGKNFTFGKVIFGPNPECNGHSESMSLNRLSDGRWIVYTQRYMSSGSLRAVGARISATDDILGDWIDYGVIIPEINANLQRYSIGMTQKHDRFYGFINCYNKSTEETEMALWVSRNGLTWKEKDSSWVPRGTAGAWDESMIFDGESLVKVSNEWWYYYSGFKYNHAHALPSLSNIGIAKIDYERIGSIHAAVGGGSYEDFTTFTEVDVAGDRIQKTTNHIDHLAYMNESTYLYKDYGVDHFDDFTHKIKIQLETGGDTYSHNDCWGLANVLDNANAIEASGNTQILLYLGEGPGSVLKVVLRESYSSAAYYDFNEGGFAIGDWIYVKIVKSGTSLNAYLYSDSGYTTLVDTLTLTLHADHTFRYLYACNTWNTGAVYLANSDIENFDLCEGGAGLEGTFISKNYFTLNSLKLNGDASGGGTIKLELLDVNGDPITSYTKSDFDTITTNGYEFVPAWGGETGLPSQPVKLKFYLEGAYLYSYLADCSTITHRDPINDLGGDWIENPDNSTISDDLLSVTEGGLNDEWVTRKLRQIQKDNIDCMVEARMKINVIDSYAYLHYGGIGLKQWYLMFSSGGVIKYVNSLGTVQCGTYNTNEWHKFAILHHTSNSVDYYLDDVLKAANQSGYTRTGWQIIEGEMALATHHTNSCTLNVDWITVRKCPSPAPTWGEWGNEETGPMPGLKKGFFYAKLGTSILHGVMEPNFRIGHEINKIPSFEFEIANCSENHTAIAANITSKIEIYWQYGEVDKLIFTGVINADGIEYVSLTEIRITGFASYVELGWPFFKHLNPDDIESVNCVVFGAGLIDYTTEANNDTVNDIPLTFNSALDVLYILNPHVFHGAQIKFSTKGCSPHPEGVYWQYLSSTGWKALDVIDESRGFTEEPGTYNLIIPHIPSDWVRYQLTTSKKYIICATPYNAYTTQPKLDKIQIVNTDVYRVYYFDTSARKILLDVLAGTGYTMDAIDQCPVDQINIMADYESPLRFIAAIANALTWNDAGTKKQYQWWIDDNKKVHMKQQRGTVHPGDITGDTTIFNKQVDYFHLANKIHGLGRRDGISQMRAIVEDIDSQNEHQLREIVVSRENGEKYITLKEELQKDIGYTKAPMSRIKGSVRTEFWLNNEYEVGDYVTLHQDIWDVDNASYQIVKANIGPSETSLDLGISREHLDGLKADLRRRIDLTNVVMHGSVNLLEFGPETMNYQRVSAIEVYSARLELEIPSETKKIHKVLVGWTLGKYRADVGPQAGGGVTHDHDGFGGAGGSFTPDVEDGGGFTPSMLGKKHTHKVETSIDMTYYDVQAKLLDYATGNIVLGTKHKHLKGRTGSADDVATAFTPDGTYWNEWCSACNYYLIEEIGHGTFAEGSHWHLNTGRYTEETEPTMTLNTFGARVLVDIEAYAFSVVSEDECPIEFPDGHIHTGVAESDHPHDGIVEAAHADHVINVDTSDPFDLAFDIYEIPGGTIMELIVNDEKVGEYATAQNEIRIDGYLSTGSNTIELQPIVTEIGKKGGATIKSTAILFYEPRKF